MDYLSEGDINAITAIAIEDPGRIGIWASSTPTGRRSKFFEWCLEAQGEANLVVPPGKYQGTTWTEYYYPSYVIPTWGDAEAEFRAMYSDIAYTHEVLADFGEEMVGVFNKQDVEDACQDYYYDPDPGYPAIRTIGVDWDKYNASTNIVITEYSPQQGVYKVINRVEIPRSERTLSHAVNVICKLDKAYNPSHIYVDRGYGEMQVEFLTEKLGKKVRGVAFSEKLEVVDPVTKLRDKKHLKPFMVNNAQITLERKRLHFSKYDDVLKHQLMEYRIVRQTQTGQPVFTSENEHALDALMLSLLAFTVEHPEIANIIKKTEYAKQMYYVYDMPFNRDGYEGRQGQEEERIVTKKSGRYSGVPTWSPRGTGSGRRAVNRRRTF